MSKYRITLNGKTYEMEIERADDTAPAAASQTEAPVKTTTAQATAPDCIRTTAVQKPMATANTVTSPMPGTILRVNVSQGDAVQQGQAILVLEAMKMENEISAPKAGKITALQVKQGDSVQGGDVLFEIGE